MKQKWKVGSTDTKSNCRYIYDAEGCLVAELHKYSDMKTPYNTEEELNETAELIAKVPYLLEEIEYLEEEISELREMLHQASYPEI